MKGIVEKVDDGCEADKEEVFDQGLNILFNHNYDDVQDNFDRNYDDVKDNFDHNYDDVKDNFYHNYDDVKDNFTKDV